MRDYGEAMQEAREKAGLSRAKLAEKIGVDMRCVLEHETGGSTPLLSYCIKCADALHISIDEFVGRTHKPAWVYAKPYEWRVSFELSQRELAARAGIHLSTLQAVERMKRDPMILSVELCADALGLGIDEYIKHEVK